MHAFLCSWNHILYHLILRKPEMKLEALFILSILTLTRNPLVHFCKHVTVLWIVKTFFMCSYLLMSDEAVLRS